MSRFGVFTLVVGFAAVCVLVMLRIPRFLLDRRITHRLGAVVLPNNWQGGAVWNIFIVTGKQFIYSVSANANIFASTLTGGPGIWYTPRESWPLYIRLDTS
jgi:hypothetical protein